MPENNNNNNERNNNNEPSQGKAKQLTKLPDTQIQGLLANSQQKLTNRLDGMRNDHSASMAAEIAENEATWAANRPAIRARIDAPVVKRIRSMTEDLAMFGFSSLDEAADARRTFFVNATNAIENQSYQAPQHLKDLLKRPFEKKDPQNDRGI